MDVPSEAARMDGAGPDPDRIRRGKFAGHSGLSLGSTHGDEGVANVVDTSFVEVNGDTYDVEKATTRSGFGAARPGRTELSGDLAPLRRRTSADPMPVRMSAIGGTTESISSRQREKGLKVDDGRQGESEWQCGGLHIRSAEDEA